MRRELSPQEFALAIAISVSARRTRMPRRQRLQSSYLDDCLEVLERRELNPKVRRLGSTVVQIEDAKRAKLAAEVREIFDLMEPVIRELTEGL